jgi:DNA-binding MarR family transcriptional regulator
MRIDRAEAAGWVRRLPHETDSRQIEVELTSQGRSLVDQAAAVIAEREAALLTDLSRREQGELDGYLRRWLAAASDGAELRGSGAT